MLLIYNKIFSFNSLIESRIVSFTLDILKVEAQSLETALFVLGCSIHIGVVLP